MGRLLWFPIHRAERLRDGWGTRLVRKRSLRKHHLRAFKPHS